MNRRPKILISILGAVVVALVAAVALGLSSGGTVKSGSVDRETASQDRVPHKQNNAYYEARLAKERKVHKLYEAERTVEQKKIRAATAGTNGTPGQQKGGTSQAPAEPSKNLEGSFGQLESEIPGEIGIAYAPLGSPQSQTLGPLQVGHAWSSFKVPISVTVMFEQGGSLTPNQESLIASAITASDNEAAAALFSELESKTGGRASAAVEQTLNAAGAPTVVATAPPPPGAVSSWGQTEWELSASTRFYNAFACDAYGGATDTILGDMENVIPEQQWGLGQASFPSASSVAFKAGWGPDGSESGPYLVRQAGIIRSGKGGAVVTIAAQDSSGSFEAGVSDLDRVADWVAGNVPLNGSC
jgi:hypothetical protein